jgi:type II secretory pathway pseudopilin PulG
MVNRKNKGFSLLEVGLAIGVTALTLTSLLHVRSDGADAVKAAAAADQITQIQQAAQIYVNNNFSSKYLVEPNGQVDTLQVADLVSAGLLPAGVTSANAYGQKISVVLTRGTQAADGLPVENGLVVTTDGKTVDDKNLGRILARIGAAGGAVLSDPPPGVPANTILGYGGGWSASASTYGVAAGHAVATLNFGANSTQFGDQLYRNYLGFPEAQTMHVPLNLNGNDLENSGAVRFGNSAGSTCQEPASGQTAENQMDAAGNPCLVFDGSTNWLTANGNGVSNGLLVGQSAGANQPISGQSLGVVPSGVQFYSGDATGLLGALSMTPASGSTIYTSQAGNTSGGVNLSTAGGDFSTAATPGMGQTNTSLGSVTAGNIFAEQGAIAVTTRPETTQFLNSPAIAGLALELSAATNNGGQADFYNSGNPVVHLGDDGAGNGQVLLRDSNGALGASLSDSAASGGTLLLQNSAQFGNHNSAVLGTTPSGNGSLQLNNSGGTTGVGAGVDGNGNGTFQVNDNSGDMRIQNSVDANGNGQVNVYGSGGGRVAYIQVDPNAYATASGQIVAAGAGQMIANGVAGVPDGYLLEASGNGYLYESGGIDDPCFNTQNDVFSLKCSLQTHSIEVQNGYGITIDGGNLNVNGYIKDNCLNDTTGNFNLSCDLSMPGFKATIGNLEVQSGATIDNGNLTVSNGGIADKCLTDFTNVLAVACGVALNDGLTVNGAGTFLNGGLTVSGARTYLQDGLTVTGGVTDTSQNGINSKCFNDTSGTFNFTCNQVNVPGTLTASQIKDSCFDDNSGTFKVTCNLSVQGDLSVSGKATVGTLEVSNGATIDNGNLTVSNGYIRDNCFSDANGNFNLYCTALMFGPLTVSGQTTLQNGLQVSSGNIQVDNGYIRDNCFSDSNGNFNNYCDAILYQSLSVAGPTTLKQGLTVNNSPIQSTAGIKDSCFDDTSGAFKLSCNLAVNGSATISNGPQGGGNTGRLGVMGYGTTPDNISFPIGWGGGIATYDLYAHGSVGVGGGVSPVADMSMDANGAGYFFIADSAGGRAAQMVVSASAMTTPQLLGLSTSHYGVVGTNTGQIVANGLVGVGSNLSGPNAYFYEDATSGGNAYVNGDIYAGDNVMAGGTVGLLDSNGNAIAYFQSNGGEGNLKVQGNSFLNNVSASGSFNSRCLTDNGSLNLQCNTTINGTVQGNGYATFGAGLGVSNGLGVSGGTTTDSLTVNQGAQVYGTATFGPAGNVNDETIINGGAIYNTGNINTNGTMAASDKVFGNNAVFTDGYIWSPNYLLSANDFSSGGKFSLLDAPSGATVSTGPVIASAVLLNGSLVSVGASCGTDSSYGNGRSVPTSAGFAMSSGGPVACGSDGLWHLLTVQ